MSSVSSEFRLTLAAADRLITAPDPFASPGGEAALRAMRFPLHNIRGNAVAMLKGAAGLSLGFNASDGD